MNKYKILILDDDEKWLAIHERRLSQSGFTCKSTQLAKEAIEIGKKDSSIKFALVDEILYVLPTPVEEEKRELQRWQGSGVIREISAIRSDIQFIVVTSAPQLRSNDNRQVFSSETAKLRRQSGVIDVIHKQDIDCNPDSEYSWLLELIREPIISTQSSVFSRVLIGLGFRKEEFESMTEQVNTKKSKYLPLSSLIEIGGSRILEVFLEKAREKCIFIEMPGSKKLDRTSIKPSSQSFQILQTLAQQSELQDELIFREQDYKYIPRKFSQDIDINSNVEQASIHDFAFAYDRGCRSISPGVHIEKRVLYSSRLKVAMSRLKKQLAVANVGAIDSLFQVQDKGYIPNFPLGIIIYKI